MAIRFDYLLGEVRAKDTVSSAPYNPNVGVVAHGHDTRQLRVRNEADYNDPNPENRRGIEIWMSGSNGVIDCIGGASGINFMVNSVTKAFLANDGTFTVYGNLVINGSTINGQPFPPA